MSDIVQKLWGFCHTLRHDGIDYGDYIEQITYLLFLKMADERGIAIPKDCDWPTLRDYTGTELTDHYIDMLRKLGKAPGLLGDIYAGAQSRFKNPVNLKRLIGLIDETEWTALNVDVKAAAYEGLLEKAASEGKKGAGQYFTPRVLIQSIVRCMKPDPRTSRDFTVCDPACGTGGFLVAAYEWLKQETGGALDRDVARRVRTATYFGQDLVDRPRRMALMNLYLHNIEPQIKLGDAIYESPGARRFEVVLTNPPFGTKGANQAPDRDDFTVSTSNKQLNFLQHVLTILKPGGRAAVVLPDNCLFADQAGEVFRIVTEDCDLHTVLRLPRGTFTPYSAGVKANVVFFTKGAKTEETWIYDARTNVPGITKKDRPLTPAHFAEFEKCYGPNPDGRAKRKPSDSKEDRWRSFSIAEAKDRDFKLDSFKWLKEESLEDADELPEPEELATDAIAELEGAAEELNAILTLLEFGGEGVNPSNSENHTAFDSLPEGWVEVLLNDAATLQRGFDLPIQDRKPGAVPVYAANGRVGNHNTFRVQGPGVVTGRSGTIGKVHYVAENFWPLNTALFVKDFHGNEPKFVALLLRHVQLERYYAGTGVPTLNRNVVHDVPVAIPPLAEQQRIIAKVEALLARVNAARQRLAKVPAILKRFRQSVLALACSGRLTADWRDGKENLDTSSELIAQILSDRNRRFEQVVEKARNNGTKPPRKPPNLTRRTMTADVLFELPESWEWVSWNDLTDWITYGFTRPMPHVSRGIPIVSAKNVRDGFLDLRDLDYTTLEAFSALSEKDKPRRCEILITKDGAIRGRAALVDTDEPFCITQAVALLRFGGLTAHQLYLLRVIQSRFTQRLIDEESSGTAIPHISITNFGRFPVPLPPLHEQHEIVRRVEALFRLADAIEKRVAAATARAEKLTQAILAKAFKGELVPTEAELARQEGRDFEPASALLERIRAERQGSELVTAELPTARRRAKKTR